MIRVLEDEERGGERSGGVLKGGQEEAKEGREDATGRNNLHQAGAAAPFGFLFYNTSFL